MNILFYFSPFISRKLPNQFIPYHETMVKIWVHNLREYCTKNGHDINIKLFTSEVIKNKYQDLPEYITIRYLELMEYFKNYEEYLSELKKDSSIKIDSLSHKIKESLGDFTPDIVIGCSTGASFLKKIYQNTIFIFHENGIFNYIDFAYSTQFLDYEDTAESYLRDAKNYKIFDDKVSSFISSFVEEVKQSANHQKLCDYVKESSNFLYKKYVLLSLQRWESELMQKHTKFSNELEYVYHVCKNINSDIGIIVTMHKSSSIISDKDIQSLLKEQFRNIIFINDTSNPSLYLMPICDAVITTSSTVGFYSSIFNKKLLITSDTSHLNHIADTNDINLFNEIIYNEEPLERIQIATFLIKYFFIPSHYFLDGKWLYSKLKAILAKTYLKTNINDDVFLSRKERTKVSGSLKSRIVKFFSIKC